MTGYSEEDKKALNKARQNKDKNEGNRKIVEIVAAKMKVPKSRLVSINLPTADQQASYEDEEGTHRMRDGGGSRDNNLQRLCCATATCHVNFSYLPVDGKAYGYFPNANHDHLPHIIPALVETSQQLAKLHGEGDEDGEKPFHESHTKIKQMVTSGLEGKHGLYAVFFVKSKEEFEALSLEEKFFASRYVGQTSQKIPARFTMHANTNKLHEFTAAGPKFVVAYGSQLMQEGEAKFWEVRVATLAASHHAIINTDRPTSWRRLPDVSVEEDYQATAKEMLELLKNGNVLEFDWSERLEKSKLKPEPLVLLEQSDESPSPAGPGMKRKRKRVSSSATPTSALNQMTLSFTFDGTLEDFDEKVAKKVAEKREEVRRQQETEGAQKEEDPKPE